MRVLVSIVIVFCFAACNKSTQVEGTVYSKHHIPVPNARITLQIFTTASSYPTTTQSKTGTDEFGHYSFEFKANTISKRYQYKVDCSATDSGHTYERHIEKGSTNHIDFNLE
jgi:hypothetical protein